MTKNIDECGNHGAGAFSVSTSSWFPELTPGLALLIAVDLELKTIAAVPAACAAEKVRKKRGMCPDV